MVRGINRYPTAVIAPLLPKASRLLVPRALERALKNYINSGIELSADIIRAEASIWLENQRKIHADRERRAVELLIRKIQLWQQQAGHDMIALRKSVEYSQQKSLQRMAHFAGGIPESTGPFEVPRTANTHIAFRIMLEDPELLPQVLSKTHKRMSMDLARSLRKEFVDQIKPLLILSFQEVAGPLPSGAFPKEYLGSIVRIIQTQGFFGVMSISPQAIVVDLGNIFESLGDSQDLREGYHYGAYIYQNSSYSSSTGRYRDKQGLFKAFHHSGIRTNANTVTLPYRGQELLNDTSGRYMYWRAMMEGKPFVILKSQVKSSYSPLLRGGKRRQFRETQVPLNPYAWHDTIYARLNYWDSIGKAPQWLLLEYGQTRFKPTIPRDYPIKNPDDPILPPGNVTGRFMRKLVELWSTLFRKAWKEAWESASQGAGVPRSSSSPNFDAFKRPGPKMPPAAYTGWPTRYPVEELIPLPYRSGSGYFKDTGATDLFAKPSNWVGNAPKKRGKTIDEL